MSQAISPKLEKYISDISDKSSHVQLEGYFHVDAVIDAFNKGEENGRERALEVLREKLVRDSTQMFLYSTDIYFKLIQSGHKIKGFYANPFGFKFIIVTTLENSYNETFINEFYELAFKAEEKFQEETKSCMNVSFIPEDNLNENELFVDGFIKLA